MTLAGQAPPPRKGRMRRIMLERRIVALCEAHARLVVEQKLDTLDDVHRHFTETTGQRSHLDRRSPLDRRILPPRPELRRRGYGRRSSDPIG
jgi:hypothetical protein